MATLKLLLDRGIRQCYRLAFPIVSFCWRYWGRDTVIIAVWVNGRILAVQQSYNPGLHMPGGGIKRGEAPRLAAVRELREEAGITIHPADLVLVSTYGPRRRGNFTYLFAVRLADEPMVTIDRREIVYAEFAAPSKLSKWHQRFIGLMMPLNEQRDY
jgi:8-oxo-dGTP diphosphatase